MTSTDQRGTWECQQALHWSWCPLVEGSDEMVPFLGRAMFSSHGYSLPWILSSWAGLRCKQSRYKHHPRAAHKRGHVVWASSDKGDSCTFHLSALKRSPNSSTPNNSRLLRKVPMRNLFIFFSSNVLDDVWASHKLCNRKGHGILAKIASQWVYAQQRLNGQDRIPSWLHKECLKTALFSPFRQPV